MLQWRDSSYPWQDEMCSVATGRLLCSVLLQLTDRNIGNSRDTSFEQLILTETNGRGVDLVLNSLSEEKLKASVRCLAPRGRFLEIGKYDLANNNPLGMLYFMSLLALFLLVLFSFV
jgi:NADPH:quinone reductase-like Zn-dependent oxidoreductase